MKLFLLTLSLAVISANPSQADEAKGFSGTLNCQTASGEQTLIALRQSSVATLPNLLVGSFAPAGQQAMKVELSFTDENHTALSGQAIKTALSAVYIQLDVTSPGVWNGLFAAADFSVSPVAYTQDFVTCQTSF